MAIPSGIVLVGGGGHCASVIDAALHSGVEISSIIDPAIPPGERLMGIEVIGGDELIPHFASRGVGMIVTVGQISNPALRIRLHRAILDAGGSLATLVSSHAYLSPNATIGCGTVILNFASVNALASIGMGCIVNTGSIVEHGVRIGDFTHISTGAIVNGDASIGSRCFVGSGAVIAQGISVADDVVIGAGSVVVRDILSPGIYFGNPISRHE